MGIITIKNKKNEVIEIFRLYNLRHQEIIEIFKEIKPELLLTDNIKSKIKKRLEHYLTIRNNEEPDYGIDWKQGWKKEEVHFKCEVLGKEMILFKGNEDNTIHFLSNLFNCKDEILVIENLSNKTK